MIKFLTQDVADATNSSIVVSYMRKIAIICGNYPEKHELFNLITLIKNNTLESEHYATNVYGGKTAWDFFVNHPIFINFMTFVINKHQYAHPFFKNFLEYKIIKDAWGNELKKGDSVNNHTHPTYHGILYLTKGNPLILPELSLEIHPNPGDYYIFPPLIYHYVEKNESEDIRYNLVFNIDEVPNWKKQKQINDKYILNKKD
jgi:hypothetical protein